MRYKDIVQVYNRLESTSKKLEKADILADFYKKSGDDELYISVVLSMGTVFPRGDQELGIAGELVKKVVAKVSGSTDKEVMDHFKKTGDLGSAAEVLLNKRKQVTLGKKTLTTKMVFDNLRNLPGISGAGSQDKKIGLIAELISSATPEEAKYIIRTTLSQMRIGVAAGIVRDAIAKAFNQTAHDIEHMHDLIGDYGHVAEQVKKGKIKADIETGRPITVMLADRGGDDVEEALKSFENPAVEIKIDGFRVQIHKKNDDVSIFSRRMENVTRQFPDIAAWARAQLKADECVVDGEAAAYNAGRNKTLPFQQLSRRIQRKHDIDKMVDDIQVQVNLFDIMKLDGLSLMKEPLKERWKILKSIIKETKNFRLIEHIETRDVKEAEKFFNNVLKDGQEGVIVKNMDAHYQPGRRVGYWIKVKPILEPLDLVVVGAEWGEGKRSNWLSSMILACRKGNKFVETGRMASGFTEEQLEELTKKLKGLVTETEGKIVRVKPTVVVEIGYEEIQASPKYPSGYAMRFPRLLRIRDPVEKGPYDADTLQTIEKIFRMQRGRKKQSP